jgi:hypothetical protein
MSSKQCKLMEESNKSLIGECDGQIKKIKEWYGVNSLYVDRLKTVIALSGR